MGDTEFRCSDDPQRRMRRRLDFGGGESQGGAGDDLPPGLLEAKQVAEFSFGAFPAAGIEKHIDVSNESPTRKRIIWIDSLRQDAVDQYFVAHGFGGFPVCEEGKVLGVVAVPDVQALPTALWPLKLRLEL